LSFALVKRFAEMEDVTVGFLMQVDKLVYLLESPIFVHMRLQLLDVEAHYHAPLLKSIYGILMCLPQGDAFRLLNERLTTVCNLRDNLGLSANASESDEVASIVSKQGLDMEKLIARFDDVSEQHAEAKYEAHKQALEAEQEAILPEGAAAARIGASIRDFEGIQVAGNANSGRNRVVASPRGQQEGVSSRIRANARNFRE